MHTFCINYCQVQIYSMYAPLHPLQRYHWPFSAFCNNWHSTYVKHHVSMHTHTRALARTHVHASTQCYVKLTEQTSDWQREHTTAHSLHVTCGQEHLRHSECVILCLNTYTHMHGYTWTQHMHARTHMHTRTCTHMDTCMYARTCTHMDTCTYKQSDSLSLSPYESVLVTFLWGVTRFTSWWEARAASISESSQSNCEDNECQRFQLRFHTYVHQMNSHKTTTMWNRYSLIRIYTRNIASISIHKYVLWWSPYH